MIRPIVHMLLHIAVPAVAARWLYRNSWMKNWFIMIAAMLIDLDHLIASPIFDPNRCSIGYHPLHSGPAICGYAILFLVPRLRALSLGLMIHVILDYVDCIWMRMP